MIDSFSHHTIILPRPDTGTLYHLLHSLRRGVSFPSTSSSCRAKSMSFLSFRHARRKAKKIVSVRSPRPPTPPTPGSFVSTAIVQIGDPYSLSAEAYYAPPTLQVDTSFATEPLLPSEPFRPAFREPSLTANPRQTWDRHSRPRSRRSGSSPKSPHVGPGSVQSKVSVPVLNSPGVYQPQALHVLRSAFRMVVYRNYVWLRILQRYAYVNPRRSPPTN